MKFISKRGKLEKDQENLRHEIGILQRLDHENIILLLDWFETENDFVVVTQFAYGELFEIFQDDKHLPEAQVSNIARQLVRALNYLHSQQVIHRDMKPQNVLVSSNGTVKLCDFGFARALSTETTVLTSIKGTPLYMAPELVQEKPYDSGVDLWSLGVICYELFVGEPPFYTNSLISLVQLIIQKPVHYPDKISSTFRSFLKGLLQKDPKCRLTWPHLLDHPFVREEPRVTANSACPDPKGHKVSSLRYAAATGTKGIKTLETLPDQPVCPWKAMEPWLDFFTEASASAVPRGEQYGHSSEPLNEDFADLCVKALELYSDVLESRLLSKEHPKVERQGLELCLEGEKRDAGKGREAKGKHKESALSLPLSSLLRGLVHIFSQASPSAVFSRLLVSRIGAQLLRLMKSLASDARSWGPAWDVLSDLTRLLGLWLRSLLTMGMTKLCNELLCADGILLQFLEIAPSLILHSKEPHVSPDQWCTQQMGVSINSVKCLGVVFSHLSTATLASPDSAFVTELFRGLDQNTMIVERNKASRRAAEAVAVLCLCLRSHPKVFKASSFPTLSVQDSEKMTRAILQALAALVHPPFGQGNVPWSHNASTRRISIRGALEVIHLALRRSLGKSTGEIAAVLWDLRHAGDRLDTSALKLLISLLSVSHEMCRQLAPNLTDSIGSGFTNGSVLTAIEAICRHEHKVLWPTVGMLLSVHIHCLRPFGGDKPSVNGHLTTSPVPPWCNLTTMQAIISCLPFAPGTCQPDVISLLCRCYALELIASMGFSLMSSKETHGQMCEAMSGVWETFTVLLETARPMAQQLMDEIQRTEGAPNGYLVRGPLDGVIAVASLQQSLAPGSAQYVQLVVHAVLAEPENCLAIMGPGALLRFLDMFVASQDFLEPSIATLKCALSILSALQCLSKLPLEEIPDMPEMAVAFEAALSPIIHLLQLVERGKSEIPQQFQRYRTVATLVRLLETSFEQGQGSRTSPCLCTALHLLTVMVLEHPSLAKEFVKHEGVQVLRSRKLLSSDLVFSEKGAAVVTHVLVILSQLARLSADYYPLLFSMDMCPALRELLSCGNPAIRAKACNAVGNMVRHSDLFYKTMKQAGIIKQLVRLCSDSDDACRKLASFAVGNFAFHSDELYEELAPALPQLLYLLRDPEEKTRANAAGAIGNLVRNSDLLCPVIIREGALEGLCGIVRARCPQTPDPVSLAKLAADSSVKIALFSLGNLAVHSECRSELRATKVVEVCHFLVNICSCEDMVHKYAKRLLQKLGFETLRKKT
ncbi:unnamed protein product [Durusdinium trenchii]